MSERGGRCLWMPSRGEGRTPWRVVLLSRLVVLDHPHRCNVTYNVNNGIQYVASQAEQNASEVGSPPSYSEALLDQRCVLDGRPCGRQGGTSSHLGAESVHTPGILVLPGACILFWPI